MKYANLKFDGDRRGSVNIGDDAQIVAVEYLYKRMGIDYTSVIRIGLSQLSTYDGEYVILPISFPLYGYREGLSITMFSPKIIPVFLGLSIMSNNISVEEEIYFRRFEPIGCRDAYTMHLLREKNIMAYVGGCLTSIFPRLCKRGGNKVFLVDIPRRYLQYIPEEIKGNAVQKSHILDTCDNPEKEFRKTLQEYSNEAQLVVTTRLHCAWPCVALGIPIVLMKEKYSFRFSALERYVHAYSLEEFGNINWNPRVVEYEAIKEQIIENAKMRLLCVQNKYGRMYEISEFYESANIVQEEYIEHFDNAIEEVCSLWKEDEEIHYAIWGITQKADLICSYIENNYCKAYLEVVYDAKRDVIFHGVQSTNDINEILRDDVFVFVSAVTANKMAKDFFKKNNKTNYYMSTDDIENEISR